MSELRQRRPRVMNEKHLAFVRSLPCVLTGQTDGVEAAHIRYANPRLGKRATGKAEKPSDIWTVPLHYARHRTDPDSQHNSNEQEFWERHGVDPCVVALALWAHTGDHETCLSILRLTRAHARPLHQPYFNGAPT